MRSLVLALFLPLLTLSAGDLAFPEALSKRLSKLAARSDGHVGIGVRNLTNGQTVLIEGERRYPMQSVYKLPIAMAVLEAVDQGQISLSQRVRVTRADISVGWSPLGDDVREHGDRGYTVESFLKEMVSNSDNTACDLLLRLTGGPARVQHFLDRQGFKGIRVDRDERTMQTQALGLTWNPAMLQKDDLQKQGDARPLPVQMKALKAYLADPRDTATPQGMLDLLQALWSGEVLSKASRDFLLKAMFETTTGPKRLKAGMAPGWKLAHKTGTSGSVNGTQAATNDVGLAIGPNGEALALVVFVSNSRQSQEQREGIAAEAAGAALALMR